MAMPRTIHNPVIAALLIALAGCTVLPPDEPSVLVLPGQGKNFDQFRADNDVCKQFAHEQVAGRTPDRLAVDSGVRSAAVGTLLGRLPAPQSMAAAALPSALAPALRWAGCRALAPPMTPLHNCSNATISATNNACMRKDIASR